MSGTSHRRAALKWVRPPTAGGSSDVAYAPDGATIATSGLRRLDVGCSDPGSDRRAAGRERGVAFAPDGRRLATASDCCDDSASTSSTWRRERTAPRSPGDARRVQPRWFAGRDRRRRPRRPAVGAASWEPAGAPRWCPTLRTTSGVRLPRERVERGGRIQPRRLDARRPRRPRHRPRVADRRPIADRQVAGQLRHREDPRVGPARRRPGDGRCRRRQAVGGAAPSMRSAPSPAAGS